MWSGGSGYLWCKAITSLAGFIAPLCLWDSVSWTEQAGESALQAAWSLEERLCICPVRTTFLVTVIHEIWECGCFPRFLLTYELRIPVYRCYPATGKTPHICSVKYCKHWWDGLRFSTVQPPLTSILLPCAMCCFSRKCCLSHPGFIWIKQGVREQVISLLIYTLKLQNYSVVQTCRLEKLSSRERKFSSWGIVAVVCFFSLPLMGLCLGMISVLPSYLVDQMFKWVWNLQGRKASGEQNKRGVARVTLCGNVSA